MAIDGSIAADGSTAADPMPGSSPASRVRIQVASYASESNAQATVERLAMSGLTATIVRAESHFRVVFTDLSPAQARIVTQRLDGLGYRGYAVTTSTPLPGNN